MKWSQPYYGLQHLQGTRRVQVTIQDFGSFVKGYILRLDSDHPFTSEDSFLFESIDHAKQRMEDEYNKRFG